MKLALARSIKIILFNALLISTCFFGFHQKALAAVPAGCSGGPAGPPSRGTICPDGTVPSPDPTLPAGCPGSSQPGPPANGTLCPARPGRPECTMQNSKCINADGKDLTIGGFTADSGSIEDASEKKCDDPSGVLNRENCGIVDVFVTAIRVLSGLVGVVVVTMIAVGGVQYAMARDNPQAVAAAKSKIINAILALVFYLLMFGFLQWLVPGGVI